MTARIKRTMPVPTELRTKQVRVPAYVQEARDHAWQRAAIVGGVMIATVAAIWLVRAQTRGNAAR